MSSDSTMAMNYKDFNDSGSIKNAWPEFQGGNVDEVKKDLEAQGVTVHIEAPRDGSPPFNPGTVEDVWLYTDGDDQVLGIPVRGTWHPNRVSPGWPDLLGVEFKKAAEIITAEQIGVEVIYGPKGFMRIMDINRRRVWLDVDGHGKVAITPRLG